MNNIQEDEGGVPANVTGDSANMAMPPTFDVEPELFRKFQTGRVKFERWSKYLDMNNENHKTIYDFAKKNHGHVIVLRDSNSGALRAIRRRSADGL